MEKSHEGTVSISYKQANKTGDGSPLLQNNSKCNILCMPHLKSLRYISLDKVEGCNYMKPALFH